MFNMNNKVYDYIKWGVIILLPAIAVLYGTLSKLYGLPCVEQVQGTIGAIQVFLGTILCISSAEYKGKEAVDKAIADLELKKVVEPKEEPKQETDISCLIKDENPTEIKVEEPQTDIPCPIEDMKDNADVNSPFVVGKCYRIIAELGLCVRDGASKDARQKKREELTEDGKKHAADQEYATLLYGTQVSCIATQGNWILIPSGWICGKDDSIGEMYIEEYTEPAGVQAIRNQLSQWSDPLHQGYDGMCEGWVHTIYWQAGLNYRGGYCCASANRDTNAENRNPQNGDLIFASPSYHNIVCGCGRHAGHVAIYMDGLVYGSQPQYCMTFDAWKAIWGYGGATNMGNW